MVIATSPRVTVTRAPAAGDTNTRDASTPAEEAVTRSGAATCRCGHDQDAHEHFRSGTDCSTCGPAGCARFASERARGLRLHRNGALSSCRPPR